MLRRRIRSALFIDFENMPLPANAIPNWLAWLEDGMFDQGNRRQFLLKRVYWNAAAEKHREAFQSHDFDVVHCDRFHGLPNSVDMRMAVDIVETTYTNPNIDEFILITRDSDFVPVLQRLDEKRKRTAFVANETDINIYTTFRQHADVIIPLRALNAAKQYVRSTDGLLGKIGRTLRQQQKAGKVTAAAKPPLPTSQPAVDPMQLALDRVIKTASLNPNKETAQTKILKALTSVPGFTSSGKNSYLGKGSYRELMKELARTDPRIKVIDHQRGMGVKYVTKAGD
jgi:uncharacterized protein (TIGR00288 family)